MAVTNSAAADGQPEGVRSGPARSSQPQTTEGSTVKYALLIYVDAAGRDDEERREMDPRVAEVLARPEVSGWLRLRDVELATSLRGTLVTDGPFIDSKEHLGGLVVGVDDDLDGALAVAADLRDARPGVGIEVRPVLD